MNYYKDDNDNVYAFNDLQVAKGKAEDYTSITEDEKDELLTVTYTDDELAATATARRDSLLTATDWVIIKATELGLTVADDWLTYRQDLRDVTEQDGYPSDITWPDEPTADYYDDE